MRTLTLRIYLTVVAVLALFAFASAWVFQRHIEEERTQANSVLSDRMAAWGELIQRSLPSVEAPHSDQAAALNDWSQRLRLPLALDSPNGERIGASESFLRRQADGASRARSSYGTRQTSPTRLGWKCAGNGSSRMARAGDKAVQISVVAQVEQAGNHRRQVGGHLRAPFLAP